jgi:hypothetical protein
MRCKTLSLGSYRPEERRAPSSCQILTWNAEKSHQSGGWSQVCCEGSQWMPFDFTRGHQGLLLACTFYLSFPFDPRNFRESFKAWWFSFRISNPHDDPSWAEELHFDKIWEVSSEVTVSASLSAWSNTWNCSAMLAGCSKLFDFWRNSFDFSKVKLIARQFMITAGSWSCLKICCKLNSDGYLIW